MTTITKENINNTNYKIEFNNKSTYFVSNEFDCIAYFSTLRKAINFLNKLK